MVKIVKKKRKLHLENLIAMIFIISCVAFVFSSTVLRSRNVLLSKQTAELERVTGKLQNDVANLEVDVKQLDNRERILGIAKDQGLKVNQDSIVTVADAGQ